MDDERFIRVMFIDRSDPNQVVCIEPVGFKGRKTSRKITRLQDLRAARKEHRFAFRRTDIAIVNIVSGDHHEQLLVHPTRSGNPKGEGLKWMTAAERRRCKQLNQAIIATAERHPEFNDLLAS